MSELIDTYSHERFIEQATVSLLEQGSQARSEKRAVVPAVTQMDGSARPQTMKKKIHPLYCQLIDEFEQHTGVPVPLNTSSHLRGEATVNRTFFRSGMGAFVLASLLLQK